MTLPFSRLEKGIILYSQVKTYHSLVFTDFQRTKLYSFHNFSLDILIKYILIKKRVFVKTVPFCQ